MGLFLKNSDSDWPCDLKTHFYDNLKAKFAEKSI